MSGFTKGTEECVALYYQIVHYKGYTLGLMNSVRITVSRIVEMIYKN